MTTTTSYRVVTYNYGDTGQIGDLDGLARYADIIALQEVGDRNTELHTFLRRHPGWALYTGRLAGSNADRLLVNVDKIGPVTVIDHPGVGRRLLGPKGAGPLFSKPKPIIEYVLQDGTRVFNLHAIASVTMSKAALGAKEYARRRTHYADYLAALLAVTNTLPGDVAVIVVGDLNSGRDFELNDILVRRGFVGWTLAGTHGDRAIDHVLNEVNVLVGGSPLGAPVGGMHSDHKAVIRTITIEKEDDMPPLLEPPYAGPAKFHGGKANKPINRLVLHATVSKCEPGMARNIARYFRSTVTRPSSAHYVIDPDESVQVVYDSYVAYHAPPNEHSLGFEMCFMPTREPDGKWKTDLHHRMLLRTVRLVAEASVLYDVPPVKLTPADLKAGKRGICGHSDISEAFHQTSHWDPGDFPWGGFMRKLEREVEAIRIERRR